MLISSIAPLSTSQIKFTCNIIIITFPPAKSSPLELITEFSDHLAIRKTLQGVKDRVEGRVEPFASSTAEFAVYLATLLIFLTALVLILVRPLTWTGWLMGLAAGAAWLVTWYAPIPTWAGGLLGLLTLWGLRLGFFMSHVTGK